MVKFVGGPSVGGYKSYINHTTAREGQWRMPRNYARPNVKIDIRNYNTCCHQQSVNTGFQLPAWLQWLQGGIGLLGGLLPQQKEEAPVVNSNEQTLKDLQKQIDDLKKENEELKNKKTNEDPKVDNTSKNEDSTKVDPNLDVKVDAQEDFEEKELPPTTDFKKTVSFKVSYGDNWDKIIDGYRGPNGEVPTAAEKKELIRQIRQKHLNSNQHNFFNTGKQNITENIQIGDKVFTFTPDNYYKSENKATTFSETISNVNTVSVAASNTNNGQRQRVSKGWSGVATVTWTDRDGKTHTAKSDPVSGQSDENSAKKAALQNVRNKVPEEYRSNAKFRAGASEK